MKKIVDQKNSHGFITLLAAVFIAIASVMYIMYRGSIKAYKEKWQDYDECGLG